MWAEHLSSEKDILPGERPLRVLAGQLYDAETGLFYNWNRYYDPRVGRYITSDPIGLDGGLNTYLYANANALRYVDPRGLCDPGDWQCQMSTGQTDAAPVTTPLTPGQQLVADLLLPGVGIPEALEIGGIEGAVLLALELPGLKNLKAAGKVCKYEKLARKTKRSVPNRQTDVTRAEFERNLESAGYTKSASKDGTVTTLQKGNTTYRIYPEADSTGGPTAHTLVNGETTVKIRLGE